MGKSRTEFLCICSAYAGPVWTFQNIQIFSLCVTGLRLAYQTSNDKCDFFCIPPPMYEPRPLLCWGKGIICPFTVLQSVCWICFPLKRKCSKSKCIESEGTLKSGTIENNNLLSCWISIGRVAELYKDTFVKKKKKNGEYFLLLCLRLFIFH